MPRLPAYVELDPTSVSIVPANEASGEDLRAIFGSRGYPAYCQCQKWKFANWAERKATPIAARVERLQDQTHCGFPGSEVTSGLVASLDGEPVGWCNVEPRSAFIPRLLNSPVPWAGRDEDPADPSVWAIPCFVVRAGYRRRGITRLLLTAAVERARSCGARALEGYPLLTEPGVEVTWGELNVGARSVFAAAGFEEVSHPTPRRVVMRIEFS
ncbi:MAG TPA: GNAT family N-acetyltransferase [Candidatus Limnocylindrales bacterium]|nr:GNAT family N-acetyltransferase [Candidatus Limnocylindrales bacterium]